MNCAEFEILLADYIDGTLDGDKRVALEAHAASCAACRELAQDVSGAVEFLQRADPVEPPPELITRIAYQAPLGRVKEPLDRPGFFSRLGSRFLQPLLQPRLAMGMAMTILSFAMLERCTGVRVQHIQAEDLNPARIWDGIEDKSMRVKDRAVKYYENIRFVYEIETKLKDFQDGQSQPEQTQLDVNQHDQSEKQSTEKKDQTKPSGPKDEPK